MLLHKTQSRNQPLLTKASESAAHGCGLTIEDASVPTAHILDSKPFVELPTKRCAALDEPSETGSDKPLSGILPGKRLRTEEHCDPSSTLDISCTTPADAIGGDPSSPNVINGRELPPRQPLPLECVPNASPLTDSQQPAVLSPASSSSNCSQVWRTAKKLKASPEPISLSPRWKLCIPSPRSITRQTASANDDSTSAGGIRIAKAQHVSDASLDTQQLSTKDLSERDATTNTTASATLALAGEEHSPSSVNGRSEVADASAPLTAAKTQESSPTQPSPNHPAPPTVCAPANLPAPACKPCELSAGLAVEFSEEEEEAGEEHRMLDSQTSRQIDRVQLFLKMDRLRRPKGAKK